MGMAKCNRCPNVCTTQTIAFSATHTLDINLCGGCREKARRENEHATTHRMKGKDS